MDKFRLTTAISGLLVFVYVAYFVAARDNLSFDSSICGYVYSIRSEYLTKVLTFITYLGNWQAISLLCALAIILPCIKASFAVQLSLSALISTILQNILKIAFHRDRPDLALHLVQQGGYSFPSGHSMTGLVFYGMIIFLCRRNIKSKAASNTVTALLSILILLIGFSRVYLGVHYPTDVIGGWSLGISLLLALTFAVSSLKRKN